MRVPVLEKNILLLVIMMLIYSANSMNIVDNSQVVEKGPGEKAVLPCRINNSKEAFWVHSTRIFRKMDKKERIYVKREYRSQWDLVIKDIRLSDEGIYKCQLNTVFATYRLSISSKGPIKLDGTSPSLVSVNEFDDVVLWCNASGKPDPEITWFVVTQLTNREEETDIGIKGPKLEIRNISRHCMASYRCYASNKFLELVTVNTSFEVQVVKHDTTSTTVSSHQIVNGPETN